MQEAVRTVRFREVPAPWREILDKSIMMEEKFEARVTTDPVPTFEALQPVAVEAGAPEVIVTGARVVVVAAAPFISTVIPQVEDVSM